MDTVFNSILTFLTWHPLTDEDKNVLFKYKRIVMVYPHTSYWDFFFYLLYFLSWSELRNHCYVLVNAWHMERIGFILKHFGCVSVGHDTVIGVVRLLTIGSKDKFLFMISPKGVITKQEWRSGYYSIAKELGNCVILPAGFDYIKRRFVFKPVIDIYNKTEENVRKELQSAMADIIPLNPEYSEIALANYWQYPNVIRQDILCGNFKNLFTFLVIAYCGYRIINYILSYILYLLY